MGSQWRADRNTRGQPVEKGRKIVWEEVCSESSPLTWRFAACRKASRKKIRWGGGVVYRQSASNVFGQEGGHQQHIKASE